ncbi:MAG TPA: WS/DGAT domain-containing protein [Acidimicrobiales bacterium]|nr:WS/DGAT domain-containing protein [Acidimicrobiales bacterium]
MAGLLNMLPASVPGSMLKHVDFLASDVPGFNRPAYLCGSRITGFHSFGPTIGAALNATLFSYISECCIGVTIDSDAVPDHDVLTECLRAGFAEVTGRIPADSPREPAC